MAMLIKDNGADFEFIKPGSVQGICVGVYDIGVQASNWNGELKESHQAVLIFELNSRMTKGENKDKRFLFSQFYTASINEKSKFTTHFKSWMGRDFTEEERKNGYDWESLIGKQAYITFLHEKKKDGGIKVVLASIIPVPEGLPNMVQETPKGYYPEWIKVKQSQALKPIATLDDYLGDKPDTDFYEDTGFNSNPVTPPEQPMKDDVPF